MLPNASGTMPRSTLRPSPRLGGARARHEEYIAGARRAVRTAQEERRRSTTQR